MKNNKIAFVTCVSDEYRYRESVRRLRALPVPAGYATEFVPIVGAPGMAAGYNRAMSMTDAAVKVYLHQDVTIVQPSFLPSIVRLFGKHERLGMLGVIGAKTLPASGVWWHSPRKYGMVYGNPTGAMALLKHGDVEGEYEPVRALDGLLLATRADIPWREDLFKGWHFYDVSQCAEYEKAGFEAGVVSQREPWCVHECGVSAMEGFEEARRVFVRHYPERLG